MPQSRAYGFGPFTLQRDERLLYRGDAVVPVGDRATDLLFALIENGARVVSKAELIRSAWPDSDIDESTLRFHISSLRKALGDGAAEPRYILNVSGRGYCFVAAVERFAPAAPPAQAPLASPLPKTRLVGRGEVLRDLSERILERRFVSIVAAGGMGKSSVAFHLLDRLPAAFPDGRFVLDVSVILDAAQVASTLAHQVGVVYPPGAATEALCRWFEHREALLVLDNCETQIDACADLAKALLQHAPRVHVLTTSREALRVLGEWVFPLKPLAVPDADRATMTRDELLDFSAVRLAVERAAQADPVFSPKDGELTLIGDLVRRLDGMPLAIEIAAARLGGMSPAQLLQALDARQLLRSASADSRVDRHRTLEALLDWSHERLSPREQTVLRRLSVCNGPFSLETAQAVAADHDLTDEQVLEAVAGLVAKSLLSIEGAGTAIRYRQLDSTRAYAIEKLGTGDEHRMVRIQQCVHLHETMLRAETESLHLPQVEWMAKYGPSNNDMRASIAWCFSAHGDRVRGVRLVAAAVQFVHHLALAEEYAAHVRRAIAALPALDRPEPDLELRLREGLFVMEILSRGPTAEMADAHERMLALSESMDSLKHRVQTLNSLFVQRFFGEGDYPEALRLKDEIAALAAGTEHEHLLPRLHIQSLHGIGEHAAARRALEALIAHPPPRRRIQPPYPIDMAVMSRMLLIRMLWLQGQADDAIGLVEETKRLAERDIRFASTNAHAWSLCPLHLWCGDRERAAAAIADMHRQAGQLETPFLAAWARAYDAAWAVRFGARRRLEGCPSELSSAMRSGVVSELLATVDAAFVTPEVVGRLDAGTMGWSAPEVGRAHGDLLLRQGDEDGARRRYAQALRWAGQQGALAWQLRAATSLARMALSRDDRAGARRLLEPVLSRFRQGLSTADYRTAAALLSEPAVH